MSERKFTPAQSQAMYDELQRVQDDIMSARQQVDFAAQGLAWCEVKLKRLETLLDDNEDIPAVIAGEKIKLGSSVYFGDDGKVYNVLPVDSEDES